MIPGLGRFPGEGNGNPLQYTCRENPMDRGAWSAIDNGVAKELDTTQRLNNDNTNVHCRHSAKVSHKYLVHGLGTVRVMRQQMRSEQ